MSYTEFKGTFLSTNGIDKVKYYICEPESNIQAILQFAHGWVDCFERNKELIDYFTSHGIMVCGCDFIGHNFDHADRCGDFKKKNAWTYLVNDMIRLSRFIRKTYPEEPLYLYGHGLGSLVARIAILRFNDYKGVILSGTSGKQHFCRRSLLLSNLLKLIKGPDYHNALIETMMQNKVNLRFLNEKDPDAWACSNPNSRILNNMGRADSGFYCMEALRDMFHMLSMVSSSSWYQSVPKDMPVLLLSGEEDPVGSFGKGIREIEKKLKRQNCKVEVHLYKGMRHNLQDEDGCEKVFRDILRWMN